MDSRDSGPGLKGFRGLRPRDSGDPRDSNTEIQGIQSQTKGFNRIKGFRHRDSGDPRNSDSRIQGAHTNEFKGFKGLRPRVSDPGTHGIQGHHT